MSFFSTIVATIAAIFLTLFFHSHLNIQTHEAALILTTISVGLLAITYLACALLVLPLQRASVNLSSRIFELLRQDRLLFLMISCMTIFPILSLALSFRVDLTETDHLPGLVAIWLILFGITLDFFHWILKRLLSYLNPYYIIELLKEKITIAINKHNNTEVYSLVDALTEIGLKGAATGSGALASTVCDELPQLFKKYLISGKGEEATHYLFYILGHMTSLYNRVVELREQTLGSHIITILGKLSLEAAKTDFSLTIYPIQYLGKFALQGIDSKMEAIGVRASLTLVAVARVLIQEVIQPSKEIKNLFLILNHQLEEIAKSTFSHDKKINLKVLKEPFYDLKLLFQDEKVVNHSDTLFILQDIDRVIADFDTLEMVLKTMPPIPQSILEADEDHSKVL